jgi:predicted RNA-binding Zn-ribbon protein involved in translation (DUF1610 family)
MDGVGFVEGEELMGVISGKPSIVILKRCPACGAILANRVFKTVPIKVEYLCDKCGYKKQYPWEEVKNG